MIQRSAFNLILKIVQYIFGLSFMRRSDVIIHGNHLQIFIYIYDAIRRDFKKSTYGLSTINVVRALAFSEILIRCCHGFNRCGHRGVYYTTGKGLVNMARGHKKTTLSNFSPGKFLPYAYLCCLIIFPLLFVSASPMRVKSVRLTAESSRV